MKTVLLGLATRPLDAMYFSIVRMVLIVAISLVNNESKELHFWGQIKFFQSFKKGRNR